MASRLPEGGGPAGSRDWRSKQPKKHPPEKVVEDVDSAASTAGVKAAATKSGKAYSASKPKQSQTHSPAVTDIKRGGMIAGAKGASRAPQLDATFEKYIPRKPTESHAVTPKAREVWLSKIGDAKTREEAALALDGVTYVPFDLFVQSLRDVTHKLSERVGNDKFVILYDPAVDDSGRPKSGMWITKLAYEELEISPELVKDWSHLDHEEVVDPANAEVKHIVIFDDASYSGEQMKRALEARNDQGSFKKHFPNAALTVVIPYVTKEAAEKIRPLVGSLITLDQPMAPSPFSEELAKKLNFDGATATYFQHKLASEHHSVVPLAEQELIGEVIPPYKDGSGEFSKTS